MTDADFTLMFDMLKKMQGDMAVMRDDIRAIKGAISSINEHISLIHTDMFRFTLGHKSLEERVARIEARLELRDQ
jgi:chromosome segregation ATPase